MTNFLAAYGITTSGICLVTSNSCYSYHKDYYASSCDYYQCLQNITFRLERGISPLAHYIGLFAPY